MTYNLSLLTEGGSVSGIVSAANTFTGELLLGLLVLSVFFIMLMALKKWEFQDSLLSSSFVSFILSGILVAGGLLNLLWALGFLALTAFTAFYMYVSK